MRVLSQATPPPRSNMASALAPLSLRLGRDGLRALDEIARRRGVSRAEAARQAIAETAERERRRAGLAAEARTLMRDPVSSRGSRGGRVDRGAPWYGMMSMRSSCPAGVATSSTAGATASSFSATTCSSSPLPSSARPRARRLRRASIPRSRSEMNRAESSARWSEQSTPASSRRARGCRAITRDRLLRSLQVRP